MGLTHSSMLLKILQRALILFVTLVCISAAAVGALVLYHLRIANLCPANGLLNGEPVTCFYRVQPTGDWFSAFGALAIGFAVCLAISWLSVRLGRPASEA
jgi:hypothetical protein